MTEPAATGLAVERTHLAWRRTALGLTAGGVAAAHVLQEFLGGGAWSIAALGALVAAVLAIFSARRNAREDVSGLDGRLVTVCASGLTVLGVGAVAFVVLHGT
ncbi:DUF202 domain-containing protein [Cellulomonas sp. URHE0023]|uniref:DUF202 domain-containing protein n=1 Tax=Cellulomonas sp. URHE0023 TaxID=1380354 RepID=UPI0004820185|nr:DUF202 domain-containing protein [Cellulomonas sp. URHE0023]